MTGASTPFFSNPRPLLGAFHAIAEVGNSLLGAIFMSLMFLFVLFLVRRVIRHDWFAAIVVGIITGVPPVLFTAWPIPLAVLIVLVQIFTFLLLARVGLVAFMAVTFVIFVLPPFPFTLQIDAWYFTVGLGGVLVISVLAIAAMRVAMAGSAREAVERAR